MLGMKAWEEEINDGETKVVFVVGAEELDWDEVGWRRVGTGFINVGAEGREGATTIAGGVNDEEEEEGLTSREMVSSTSVVAVD